MVKGDRGRYKSIQIPEPLLEQIQKLLKEHEELGFTSMAEFVKVAIREKLKEYGYDLGKTKSK